MKPDLFEWFEAALARPPAEWESIIAGCLKEDPAMGELLRQMLEARCNAEPREEAISAVLIPDMIFDKTYRLDQPLGQGSFAQVWQAWSLRLDAPVALKIFPPHRGMSSARVLSEARAASAVYSPYVVRIHHVGQCADTRRPYIEMELCGKRGGRQFEPSQDIASCPPRSKREAVRLAMETALGMQVAHETGVVHRDLKLENIIGHLGSAKVTDWGCAAKPATIDVPAPERRSNATPPGGGGTRGASAGRSQSAAGYETTVISPDVVGTPAYMSPEAAAIMLDCLERRAAAHPNAPDARTEDGFETLRRCDIYGVGVVLYEMLRGQPPYEPTQRQLVGLPRALEVLRRVIAGPPPPLQARAGPTQRFAVDASLRRVVDKAMARDPRQRYASCAVLADDLRRWLALRPTSLDGVRPLLRAKLFARRRWDLVSSSALLLCVIASLSWGAWQAHQLRSQAVSQAQAALSREKSARAEAGAAERDLQSARQELARAEEDRRRASAAAVEARSQAEAAARRQTAASEQLQQARSQLRSAVADLKEEERELAAVVARLEQERAQLSQAQADRRELQLELESTRQELTNTRAALASGRREVQAARAARRRADQDLQRARAELRHAQLGVEHSRKIIENSVALYWVIDDEGRPIHECSRPEYIAGTHRMQLRCRDARDSNLRFPLPEVAR